MVRVVITHGRSQEFTIPSELNQPWADAFRFGLQRIGSPFKDDIQATFAFYGDHWRPDAEDMERAVAPERASELEREIAADMLAHAPTPAGTDAERGAEEERGIFSSLVSIVAELDDRFHVGELALRWFMKDVAEYFEDAGLRDRALQRVHDAIIEAEAGTGEGVLLLGHSLGTVVAYDYLRRTPDAPVHALITFGSPLGLPTVRRRLVDTGGPTVFPDGLGGWHNVFDPDDFVVGERFISPHFLSTDGRAVKDVETHGENPGIFDPAAAHDAKTYLSSVALAQSANDLMLQFWGAPAGTERGPTARGETVVGGGPVVVPASEEELSADAPVAVPPEEDVLYAFPAESVDGSSWDWASDEDIAKATDADAEASDGGGGGFGDPSTSVGDFGDPSPSAGGFGGGSASDSERGGFGGRATTGSHASATRSFRRDPEAERGTFVEQGSSAEPPAPAPPPPAPPTGAAPPPEAAPAAPPSPNGETEPAPSQSPPEPRMMRRTASADFPPSVEPESENLLQWAIAQEPVFGGASGDVSFPVPRDVKEVTLTVSVQASGFDILDPDTLKTRNFTRVTLDVENPAQVVGGAFLLRARETETMLPTKIYLRLSHLNVPVGQLELPTVIAPPGTSVATARSASTVGGSMQVSFSAAPPPDLVFHVTQTGDGQRYEIFVDRRSGPLQFDRKELGEFPITGNAAKFSETILEQFRLARELKPELRPNRIDGLGLSLWNQLPEQFRDFYWEEMHGKSLSIAIHSEEPYIPWELIKPQKMDGSGETADMFGLQFSIARWKQGRFYPNPLNVSGFAAIAPVYKENALENTAQEAEALINTYGGRLVPGQYAEVAALLSGGGVQAIHFAGHGKFAPTVPNDSRIELADFPLLPSDVLSAKIGKTDRPMVFMNACEVGNQGWSLTQIGGWADTFCDVGFTAFVGPYWAVNDRVAKAASLLFYKELSDGKTVGEAMRTLRRQFWEAEQDRYHPTWLAYSLHCHPNVTVKFTNSAQPAAQPAPTP